MDRSRERRDPSGTAVGWWWGGVCGGRLEPVPWSASGPDPCYGRILRENQKKSYLDRPVWVVLDYPAHHLEVSCPGHPGLECSRDVSSCVLDGSIRQTGAVMGGPNVPATENAIHLALTVRASPTLELRVSRDGLDGSTWCTTRLEILAARPTDAVPRLKGHM